MKLIKRFKFWKYEILKESKPRILITLLFIGGTIITVGTIAVVSYSFVRSLMLEGLKATSRLKLEEGRYQIDHWLFGLKNQVGYIGTTPMKELKWDVMEPILQLRLDNSKYFRNFLLVFPDGSYYTTEVGFAKGKNVSDRRYFKEAMLRGAVFVDDPVVSRTTGRKHVNIAAPIWQFPPYQKAVAMTQEIAKIREESLIKLDLPHDSNKSPEIIGLVSGQVNVDVINHVVGMTKVGEGSYAFVLDSEGNLIASRQISQLAQNLLKSKDPALAAIAKDMTSGKSNVERIKNIDHKWVYIAYSPLKEVNWSIAIVIPSQNIDRNLYGLDLLAVVVGCLLIIAMIIGVYQAISFERTRDRALTEALLNRLVGRVRESLKTDIVIQTTVAEISNLLNTDQVQFFWFNCGDKTIDIVCSSNNINFEHHLGVKALESCSYFQNSLCKELITVNDIDELTGLCPNEYERAKKSKVISYAVIPIVYDERLHSQGYLFICRSYPWIWKSREIEILNTVGSQLAIAITQAWLYQTTNDQYQLVSKQANELTEKTKNLKDTLGYVTAIIKSLADALLVVSPDNKILQINPALIELYGLDDQEFNDPACYNSGFWAHEDKGFQGKDCQSIFGSALADLVILTQTNTEQIYTAEVNLPQNRIGKAVATAIVQESDSCNQTTPILMGSVIMIRDITFEKEIDRMKTDFISTVSHELRTPLTSVIGFAKLIHKKLQDQVFPMVLSDDKKIIRSIKQVNDNLVIIIDEGERLKNLINDILDLAKLEAGKVDWKFELININDILSRAITATTALFEDKNISCVQEIQPDLPPITGDFDRLLQVVINLISNAVKFTPEGNVIIKSIQTDKMIKVSVIDSGIGISENDQKAVFEKFKQVGDTLTDKPKGTGLGLPICKEIIENHWGRIWVESPVAGKKGSNFSFTIPIPIDSNIGSIEMDFGTLIGKIKNSGAIRILDQKSILIVDDEPSIRQLVMQCLNGDTYKFYEAHNGLDAIEISKQERPNLIILDIMMPQLNGFDTAAVLKNDPATMDLPILILSVVEDPKRFYSLGIDDYTTKPIISEDLNKKVGALLNNNKNKKRILLVINNISQSQVIVDALNQRGCSTFLVGNTDEILEKSLSLKPHIIIVNQQIAKELNLVNCFRNQHALNIFFVLVSNE